MNIEQKTYSTNQMTSKTLKLQLLVSSILFWIGFISFVSSISASGIPESWMTVTLLGGSLWYCVTKIRIWWQHA